VVDSSVVAAVVPSSRWRAASGRQRRNGWSLGGCGAARRNGTAWCRTAVVDGSRLEHGGQEPGGGRWRLREGADGVDGVRRRWADLRAVVPS
jgi:hypothetical protein